MTPRCPAFRQAIKLTTLSSPGMLIVAPELALNEI
jgi:hypothetical protein